MKPGRGTLRRTIIARFTILDVLILGVLGTVLYVNSQRYVSEAARNNLRQTTETVFGMVETVAENSVRNYLRASVERAMDVVRFAYGQYRSGVSSEAEAKGSAIRRLSAFRIGETGYVFLLDMEGILVYHPSPDLNGKPAPASGPLEEQLRMREGYLEYTFQTPEESAPEPKAVSMMFFEPWHWIVSATSYRREFDRLVNPDGFRAYVLGLTFGKGGYVYIVHQDGTVIIHPKLTGNPLKETGDSELRAFHETVRREEEGETSYVWQNPDAPRPERRTAFFKQLPRFRWIVVSVMPQSELLAPAYGAGVLILAAVALAILASVFLIASIAASVARPLEDLAARLEAGAGGDFSVRLPDTGRGEVGRLAGHFNRFMDGLQAARDRLARSFEERTRAEEARARLAAAVEQISELVMITDPGSRIYYVNPAFERVTGWSAEEALGRKPDILASGRHGADFFEGIWAKLRAGEGWRGRIVNRRRDGKEFVQEGSITPVRDGTGAVVSYVAVNRDVTREVEEEERRQQGQRLEAIGTLAGGIAHDFNNILTAILGFAELGEQCLEADHPARESLREIASSGNRARELVAKILAFSRKTKREPAAVDAAAVVREALKLLRASLPATVAIETRIDPDAGRILADPTEIHQTVLNLCTNAAQAIGERPGTIAVSVRRTRGAGTAAERLEISVADDGVGMEPEVLPRIFEPFFTTKAPGEGTGLGLAVVHGIVSRMGGEILAESRPGAGTTMRILLPILEGGPGAAEAPDAAVPGGRGEPILLVEDEAAVRSVCTRILEALSYRVTAVADAEAALRAVEADPGGFRLVLSDLTMTGMTGLDLAQRLSRLAPRLPVALMTGSIGRDVERRAREAGAVRLLSKPFRRGEVAVAVREILDGKGPAPPS